MKVLALDTATSTLSLALSQREDLVANYQLKSRRQHGATLTQVIHQVLGNLAWDPLEIDRLVVGVGPGSYTGLRMGVTLAKMWADFTQADLVAVSSLALLAGSVEGQLCPEGAWVVPIIDGRRQTAYTGIYQWQAGNLVSVVPDQQVPWTDFMDEYLLAHEGSLVFVGHEIDSFIEDLPEGLDYQVLEGVPTAATWNRVPQSLVDQPELLVPEYLHATLAEREWAQAHNRGVAGEEENASFIDFNH